MEGATRCALCAVRGWMESQIAGDSAAIRACAAPRYWLHSTVRYGDSRRPRRRSRIGPHEDGALLGLATGSSLLRQRHHQVPRIQGTDFPLHCDVRADMEDTKVCIPSAASQQHEHRPGGAGGRRCGGRVRCKPHALQADRWARRNRLSFPAHDHAIGDKFRNAFPCVCFTWIAPRPRGGSGRGVGALAGLGGPWPSSPSRGFPRGVGGSLR